MADQALTRAAALNAKPAVVLTPDVSVNVATINALAADDRVTTVQEIVNNVNASVLARLTWAINYKDVLWLADLEAVIDELQMCGILRILRRVNSNAAQDELLVQSCFPCLCRHTPRSTACAHRPAQCCAFGIPPSGTGIVAR